MSSLTVSIVTKRAMMATLLSLAAATPANGWGAEEFAVEAKKDGVEYHTAAPVAVSGESVFVQDPVRETRQRPDLSSPYRRTNHRTSTVVLNAFREAIGDNWKATATIYQNDQQVALATVVDRRGWLITKASEIYDRSEFQVRLSDGRQFVGEVVAKSKGNDLALIRLPVENLPAISWKKIEAPGMGAWLISTDVTSTPLGIGVVSASSRRISPEKPVLGVSLSQAASGALISVVLPGSGAEEAGMQINDIVEAIDGEKLPSRQAVLNAISKYDAGQWVNIQVRRGNEEKEFVARLKDISAAMMDPTEQEVNGLISARSTGFGKVLQHDSVLAPYQCGGPVFDSSGQFAGINIARSGRVSSYSLPIDVLRTEIEQMYASLKPADLDSKTTVSTRDGQP